MAISDGALLDTVQGATRLDERTSRERTRIVLRSVFADAEASNLFVVLRNSESLPDALAGNDLDLSVLPGVSLEAALQFVRRRASVVGWEMLCVSRRASTHAASLVDLEDGPPRRAIHVDIFCGISAFGIRLLSPELLARESTIRGNVRELSDRVRVLATVAHHFACSGALTKDKYLDELMAVLARDADRDWLLRHVEQSFGPSLIAELTGEIIGRSLRTPSLRRRKMILLGALEKSAAHKPGFGLVGIAQYTAGQFPSLLHPPGIIGRRGERLAALPQSSLTPELASGVSPLAMIASDVHARASEVWTLNSDKHLAHVRSVWANGALLRRLSPSLFLWWQAKRNRVVVLNELPLGLRLLRRITQPQWLTVPDGVR